jgi:hypothetical protein
MGCDVRDVPDVCFGRLTAGGAAVLARRGSIVLADGGCETVPARLDDR